MKADFSRVTFDPKKHYLAVRPQQGRVITDADGNEEHDILTHRAETTFTDVIGPSGTPKDAPGFTLSVNNNDLVIGTGRYYVEGLLIENDAPTAFNAQPYFAPGAVVRDVLTNASAKLGLVYLDGFTRVVTALEDPSIRETALGGPDTAVREQVIWQVKVLPIKPVTSVTCESKLSEWKDLFKTQQNTLIVQTPVVSAQDELCSVPAGAGYQSGENQLYRVEVHAVAANGGRSGSFFKWSRENGSVAAAIEKANAAGPNQETTAQVRVTSTGRDAFLGFKTGDWVEYVDEDSGLRRPLSGLRKITVDGNVITLDQSIQVDYTRHPKLIRWDQPGVLAAAAATANGVAMNAADGAFIKLENNLEVSFGSGAFKPGQHWLIPARATTGQHEFPAGPQPPAGPRHRYAKLGLVRLDNANNLHILADCRELFPPLTNITADDVSYNNTKCAELAGAQTVQQALDILCHTQACCLRVSPQAGWEAVFARIQPGQDAHICFEDGDYPLAAPVAIVGKGNLTLSGCGPGSRILAPTASAALRFVNCKKISVRELYVETGIVGGNNSGRGADSLNSVLRIADCEAVDIERVVLKCGAGVQRTATCLTVRNGDNAPPRPVRIERSEFHVGHMQTGMLLVNASRARIADNLVRVYNKPVALSFAQMVQDPQMRASLRRVFLSGAILGEIIPANRAGSVNVRVEFNGHVIQFKSLTASDSAWNNFVGANANVPINSPLALLRHTRNLIDQMLIGNTPSLRIPTAIAGVLQLLRTQQQAVAAQGIVIGGIVAHHLQILDNTIENALQGVHIGLSRTDASRNLHLLVGASQVGNSQFLVGGLTLSGNRVFIRLPVYAGKLDRHGVYIGSCNSLLIENNDVSLERLSGAERVLVDGMRIYGKLGQRALVSMNYIHALDGVQTRSFDHGVVIHPFTSGGGKPPSALWLVQNNVAPSVISTVKLDNGVAGQSNTP